jgi:hypothetical protein
MISRISLCLALGAALCAARVHADTVHLTNGGRVEGTITHLRLSVGGDEVTLARKQLQAVKFDGEKCAVVTAKGDLREGRLLSVAIRSVGGLLGFDGKAVRTVTLAEVKKRGKPEEKQPANGQPKADAADNGDVKPPPKPKLTKEQIRKIKGLLKSAADLRDAALKKAAERSGEEDKALKGKYLGRWQSACQDVKEKQKAYAEHASTTDAPAGREFRSSGLGVGLTRNRTVTSSGPAGDALSELRKAEAKKRALARTIQEVKRRLKTRAHVRRERIRAYYYAIRRNLISGKIIPEDAMEKIYDKALKRDK